MSHILSSRSLVLLNSLTLIDLRSEAVQGGQQLNEDLKLAIKELSKKINKSSFKLVFKIVVQDFMMSQDRHAVNMCLYWLNYWYTGGE